MDKIEKILDPETGEILETSRLELLKKEHLRPKVVDDREPYEVRYELLKYGWQQRRLYAGDYYFMSGNYKKVGFERKEIRDLLGSIGTRIEHELEGLIECYDERILIIEGSWSIAIDDRIGSKNGIEHSTFDQIMNFLQTWQDKGIRIQLSPSLGWTIRRLNSLFAYYQKEWHTGGINGETYGDNRVLAFPSGCRGKTALNVLKTFGSLYFVSLAKTGDFRKIEGIGEKKAELIYNHFHKTEGVSIEIIKREPEATEEEATIQEKML